MLSRAALVAALPWLLVGKPEPAGAASAEATPPRWIAPLSDRCPSSPPDLALVPGVQTVGPCDAPPAVYIHGLQATARGWIAHTSYGLEAFAEDGRMRWRYDNRSNCHRYYGVVHCTPLVTDFVATSDGGAWTLENTEYPESHYSPDRLRRIRPDGTLGEALDLGTLPNFTLGGAASHRIVAYGADGAALFWANPWVGWLHIGQLRVSESRPPELTETSIGAATPEIDLVKLLPDGDALVAFTPNAFARHCVICEEAPRMSAARITASGQLVWRTDSALPSATQATVSSHGVWIGNDRQPATLQRIDVDGVADAVQSHPSFGPDEWHLLVAGADGELLFLTSSGAQRLAPSGSVLSQSFWEAPGMAVARTQAGTLVAVPGLSSAVPDLLAFDPRTLLPQLRGFFNERPSDGPVFPYVAAGGDGAFATLRTFSDDEGRLHSELARFDVPGSNAEATLHRDGFEP